MKFIKMLKQVAVLSYKDSIWGMGIVLAGGITGCVIMTILMQNTMRIQEEQYIALGTLLGFIFGMLYYFCIGIFGPMWEFHNAVCMGRTRKSFVPARICLNIIYTSTMLITVFLVSNAEKLIYNIFFQDRNVNMNIDFLFRSPIWITVIIILFPIANSVLGALYIKFSFKFFWCMWAVWMFIFLMGPRVAKAAEKTPNSLVGKIGLCIIEIIEQLSALSMGAAAGSLILISAVMGIITFLLLSKQRAV